MNQETPHTEAPPSLADGVAAIARELRAMADAQVTEARVAAVMQASIVALLVGILLRLEAMIRDWQQGRLTLPPLPAPASLYVASTRPDSLHRLARIARAAPRRARAASPAPTPAGTPSRAATPRPHSARPAPPPGAGPAIPLCPAPRRPAPFAFSKPALAAAPSHADFVTIS